MPIHFIDTHTHLFLDEFNPDRDQVIAHAIESNVSRLLIPNIDVHTIEPMLLLCNKYPAVCFPFIGIHPSSVKVNWQEDMIKIESLLKTEKFYAIGEIGLDLYWDVSKKDIQQQAFIYQLAVAKQYHLPVSIHSRQAVSEIIDILDHIDGGTLRGVFHCFAGTLEQAQTLIAKGFKIGVGGVVTFKNSTLPELLRCLPLESIILETDAPFLAPVPYRGKRNESAYIAIIAQKIAELKKVELEQVAEVTTKNAVELFQLP